MSAEKRDAWVCCLWWPVDEVFPRTRRPEPAFFDMLPLDDVALPSRLVRNLVRCIQDYKRKEIEVWSAKKLKRLKLELSIKLRYCEASFMAWLEAQRHAYSLNESCWHACVQTKQAAWYLLLMVMDSPSNNTSDFRLRYMLLTFLAAVLMVTYIHVMCIVATVSGALRK